MKILFTGGGTGGHVLPIIAVAREIRRGYTAQGLQMFFIGPRDNFGDVMLSQEGIKSFTYRAGKVRRYGGIITFFQNILDVFFQTPLGILKAFWTIFFLGPDLIFSKGGYGAIPAIIAGWFLGVPIFLHESDVVPGLANRIAGHFALAIFTSFPYTRGLPSKKILLIGNPIRRELLIGSKTEAAELFHLVGDKPVLLIMGGSQGSQRINDMLLAVLDDALSEFEIIHQAGENNFSQLVKEAKVVMSKEREKYYHPVAFLNETDLRHAYAAADFIVSRAGSGSIFEIAALGKPSILVPLPESAQNHQLENAYAYANTKAALVLEEVNLLPHFFLQRIKDILFDPREVETMRKAALAFAKPDAARIVAYYILEYLH